MEGIKPKAQERIKTRTYMGKSSMNRKERRKILKNPDDYEDRGLFEALKFCSKVQNDKYKEAIPTRDNRMLVQLYSNKQILRLRKVQEALKLDPKNEELLEKEKKIKKLSKNYLDRISREKFK